MIQNKTLKCVWNVIVTLVIMVGLLGGESLHHVARAEEVGPDGKPTYVVGLDDSFAPMGFRDSEGNLVGFDIDLANEVAAEKGWNLKFQPIDWAVKETELNNGNIDMIWSGLGITPEREETMDMTDPYLSSGQIIVTKKNSPIKQLSDLEGKKVSTQAASTTAENIKNWPDNLYNKLDGEPVLYSDYNSVFSDLDADRVDAVVCDHGYGLYMMKQRGMDRYSYFDDESAEPEQMAVAVKKGNTELRDELNDGLAQAKASGKTDEIYEKWFGEEAESSSRQNIVQKVLPSLLSGLKLTVGLFLIVLVLSVPIGFIIAVFRVFGPKWLRWLISLYIFVMRGTPLMLQLMVVFFGLPFIGISLNRYAAAVLAFVVNYAAYLAEIFRGGIESVPKGQYEAISVLGIGQNRGFRRIILPQVFKIVLPSFGNEVISLVKDTSLVYVIGLGELLRAGSIAANTYASIVPYLMCGCIYLILTACLTAVLNWMEYRLDW